jgi:hypothetical protein
MRSVPGEGSSGRTPAAAARTASIRTAVPDGTCAISPRRQNEGHGAPQESERLLHCWPRRAMTGCFENESIGPTAGNWVAAPHRLVILGPYATRGIFGSMLARQRERHALIL